nr:type II toxin-antitoxin system RelE/ParE family toxin [Alteromonas confluentis]
MIYKTKEFVSLTKKTNLSDTSLVDACNEIAAGLFDADLGGNVYKKRIATGHRGKSAGYRTIIGANIGNKYFFLYAFSKKTKANISASEKLALKEIAMTFLNFTQAEIDTLIEDGELFIVGGDYE